MNKIDENMPLFAWLQNYDGEMGHGEWDDYEPFDKGFAIKYIKFQIVEQLLLELISAYTATDDMLNNAMVCNLTQEQQFAIVKARKLIRAGTR